MNNHALVSERIRQLVAYRPDEPLEELRRRLEVDEVLRLSSNENLFGPSPWAVEAIRQAAGAACYYPDGGGAGAMREAIARFHDIDPAEIITANGSNEVITLLARTFCERGEHSAVTFDYGFIIYALVCRGEGIKVRRVPVGEGFRLDTEAMLNAVDDTTRLAFIANPNNPTGTYVPADEMRAFLQKLPDHVIAVIDEAYVQYARADDYASALTMRDCHERLVVLRTFSKAHGLAGLRIGYGIGPAPLIEWMHRLREPFTCNGVAQAAAPAALKDRDHVDHVVRRTEEGRRAFIDGLAELQPAGVEFTPTQANFMLLHTPGDAQPVAHRMKQRGVLVRPMHGYGLPQSIRVAIVDRARMHRCIEALRTSLSA